MLTIKEKKIVVFIPFPVMSHLVTAVKTAKLLSDRDERLAVTVLIMNMSIDNKISSYINNSPDSRVNFVQLPEENSDLLTSRNKITQFLESQKGPARDAVVEILKSQKSNKIGGFVVDMFCTAMIDVADELGAPAYVFFSSGAASLGLMLHLQSLKDDQDQDLTEYKDSDAVISVSTYVNPVPARVWPSSMFDKERRFHEFIRRFRLTKGIIVNTFLEFEHHAITALSADDKIPPVYPIGPMHQDEVEEVNEESNKRREGVLGWLDEQPQKSVVFLCFGSRGSFEKEQVKEIAVALERSGQRFLWSLRKATSKEKMIFPGEFENFNEVLPEGFLDRVEGTGKVIGWAPQMAVLSHPAVGGFVSQCGWNSTLESVWCGVPMAAWPLDAEQQANAFQLVKDFGMAVEIQIDYRRDSGVIVGAENIEKAIGLLMDPNNEVRAKVKALKEHSRKALVEGESSYNYVTRLVNSFT